MVQISRVSLSIESIVSDLRRMGINAGDTLFLRADIGSVGRISKSEAQTYHPFLEALLETVGPEGTIVSLAYTPSYFLRAPRDKAFDRHTKSTAGALPNMMLSHSDHFRSGHPTNSVVAIGRNAEFLTEGLGPNSPAYEPIRRIVELDAKMLLVGIAESSPGFTTAHLAEYDLGLHRRVIFPQLLRTYYRGENNSIHLFKRNDAGLCSFSFAKFYSEYIKNGLLVTGNVGSSYSIMLGARAAYDLERSILKDQPRFNICGHSYCVTCNARRWDQLHRLPWFFLKVFFRVILAKDKVKAVRELRKDR